VDRADPDGPDQPLEGKEPDMTDKTLTHIYFLLDRSGSMQSIRTETQAGFDAFVSEQRGAAGRCRVTLAQFDDQYDEVYAECDIADVPPLDLVPRGSTALLDSLGRLVVTAGERLAALSEPARPGSVIVGVMTDGYENASQDWTYARIKELIEQQTRDYGWQFMYLGADQDAIEEGAKMGFARADSLTYARGKADKAMAAASRKSRSYRDAVMAGATPMAAAQQSAFTDEEREAAGE
jgi:uncharacterized protein YegL